MVDKMLEDDIIDLTDLLEEGKPPQEKGKPVKGLEPSKKTNEPDSFDLGKEISMEYDVSVEEIEHAGESLDIDASLSSNEEAVLKGDKGEGGDFVISEEDLKGAEKELDASLTKELTKEFDEKDLVFEDREVARQETKPDKVVPLSDRSPKAEKVKEERKPQKVEAAAEADVDDLLVTMNEPIKEEAKKVVDKSLIQPVIKEEVLSKEGQDDSKAVEKIKEKPQVEIPIQELKEEIPQIIEGIVKPLISELVKEIITTSRDQLPGIVEKIIREEIDKLKKLDSKA